jgi:hypothetical protein
LSWLAPTVKIVGLPLDLFSARHFSLGSRRRAMIPDTVRTLTEIEELDGSEQLIHAVSLLEYLLAVSPKFQRDDEMDTLGTVINRHRQHFAQISDLNFALGVRNKIIHPRPANADDPDLTLAAVRRASSHVIETIARDVAQHVPPEIRAALLVTWKDFAAAGSQSPPERSDTYVAGWRYEERPPTDLPMANRSLWQAPRRCIRTQPNHRLGQIAWPVG